MDDSHLLRAFSTYQADLVRFLASRLKCLFTAKDLSQEVYLRAARVDDANKVRDPRAFLFQVAANLAADHQRVEGRRAELLREAHDLLWGCDEGASPEQQTLNQDELAHVGRAIEQLPELSRRIFAMNRFDCLTQREIAGELGLSLSTVEKHIRIVLKHLSEARESGCAQHGTAP